MKTLLRDSISTVFMVLIGTTVFAKLNNYSWPLIGSWKGALAVLAVLGLGVLLTDIIEIAKSNDFGPAIAMLFWAITGTFVIASLFAHTTKAEFVWSSLFIAISWLTLTGPHLWSSDNEQHTQQHLHA